MSVSLMRYLWIKFSLFRYDEDSSGEIGFTEFVILMKKQVNLISQILLRQNLILK